MVDRLLHSILIRNRVKKVEYISDRWEPHLSLYKRSGGMSYYEQKQNTDVHSKIVVYDKLVMQSWTQNFKSRRFREGFQI